MSHLKNLIFEAISHCCLFLGEVNGKKEEIKDKFKARQNLLAEKSNRTRNYYFQVILHKACPHVSGAI